MRKKQKKGKHIKKEKTSDGDQKGRKLRAEKMKEENNTKISCFKSINTFCTNGLHFCQPTKAQNFI